MRASAPLLLWLALLLVVGAAGCKTDRSPPSGSGSSSTGCERLPIPAFPVGVNVVDLPDDKDEYPTNDGARGLGSDAARRTLDRLKALGLDGVVLPVGLHASSLEASSVRPGSLLDDDGRRRLGRMIDDAHARGLFVVLVPHLQLDDGAWRGDLTPADLDGFLRSYEAVVGTLADVGERHCAEVLSAGVELKSLTKDPRADEGFTRLARTLRERFSGELTYSANWDEVDTVRHWALFDRAGVNAFHPLAFAPGADDDTLRTHALGAQRALADLEGRIGRPVWFVEVGFKAVPETHLRPWEWPSEVQAHTLPYDDEAQARAYRAVIWALRHSDAVDGVFFWMVPSDLDDGEHAWRFEPQQGFSFLDKAAEAEVRNLVTDRPGRVPLSPPPLSPLPQGRYSGEDG